MKPLDTAEQVLEALGGSKGVRTLLRGVTPNTISNWKRGGRFPAQRMDSMLNALMERGYTAPPSLWGQR